MKPNKDKTYCTNDKCRKKCWIHTSNWKFEKDKNYWFMKDCVEDSRRQEEK